uniref:C2H2-type domain-containing protein n=1 Tax=Glossina morsitans morsitans TaxID=37546 RepID=A0A1B0FAF8_GLOMM
MAASIYATPPPDLSSEDTALSDVSVASSSAAETTTSRTMTTTTTTTTTTAITSEIPAIINQPLCNTHNEAPSSIVNRSTTSPTSSTKTLTLEANREHHTIADVLNDDVIKYPTEITNVPSSTNTAEDFPIASTNCTAAISAVASIEQLKETFGLLWNQQQNREQEIQNISSLQSVAKSLNVSDKPKSTNMNEFCNPYQMFCRKCGENFNNEFKLNLHLLQEHNLDFNAFILDKESNQDLIGSQGNSSDILTSVRVKLEEGSARDNSNSNSNPNSNCNLLENDVTTDKGSLRSNDSKNQIWPRPGSSSLSFSVTPEQAAAATLQVGRYLPLLNITGFPNVDGIHRPPMRVFNSEAFCELCNKEFCNKYFLKTHKANKHGIFDSVQETITSPALTAFSCGLCSKAFANIFALRRHRAKAHETNQPSSSIQIASNSTSSEQKPDLSIPTHSINDNRIFQMSADLRQDLELEQEDVSFAPQPRKLSPQSQQQAREANFSYDELKRLGIVNPEAFCELCCKEYRSKYFLRTHKWKRHGIFMPCDDSENQRNKKYSAWPFLSVPDSPLNFMMAHEQTIWNQALMAESEKFEESMHRNKRIKLETLGGEYVTSKTPGKEENPGSSSEDKFVDQDSSKSALPTVSDQSEKGAPFYDATLDLQNLQKLQSMIQHLTDFSGKKSVTCHLCAGEFENQCALEAHLLAKHNGGIENKYWKMPSKNQSNTLKQSPSNSPGSGSDIKGLEELRCSSCDREFISLSEFQKHIAKVHLLSAVESPFRESFVAPERPINANTSSSSSRPSFTITPTSSYCEICNKELCNKYFMKTHMQRMHGIEIENGAQIGGVVCNICNKELCSKYFLRVHKHNTHGIIDEGAPLQQSRQNGLSLDSTLQQPQQQQQQQQQQSQIMEFEAMTRGTTNVSPASSGAGGTGTSDIKSENYPNYPEVCPICTKRFRNAKFVRSHLLSDHAASGSDKLGELEHFGNLSKSSSPTLKITNDSDSSSSASGSHSAQLGHALQNLNTQHILHSQMHKHNILTTGQSLESSHFKEYQCSICPFTTPYYAFLFIHEKTHAIIDSHAMIKHGGIETESREEQPHSPIDIENEEDNKKKGPILNADKRENEEIEFKTKTMTQPLISSTVKAEGVEKPKELITQVDENSDGKYHLKAEGASRSMTTSPTHSMFIELLPDMMKKIDPMVTRPVPKNDQLISISENQRMQAFFLEPIGSQNDLDQVKWFTPAIVYLPVNKRLAAPVSITFKLTPA